jgi:hypothetical protein
MYSLLKRSFVPCILIATLRSHFLEMNVKVMNFPTYFYL